MSRQDKPVIQEVIVVEGKDDTRRIKEVLQADTIETIGSALNAEILERIRHANEVRGVIVLTDPDFPGEKIRKQIMAEIPTAKHAFIKRDEGVPKKKGQSLGVEHASDAALMAALKGVVEPVKERSVEVVAPAISQALLLKYGLLSGASARSRRQRLGEILRIGYTNGKQLRKRLAMFQITEEDLHSAMKQVLQEEKIDG